MSYTANSNKRNKIMRKGGVIFIAAIIGICMLGFGRAKFFESHFARNTMIQGVECSYFSIPKAAEAISEALSNKPITLVFGEKEYHLLGKDFGLELADTTELEKILADQQEETSETGQIYNLKNSFKVNEEMVQKCLEEIDELKEENMIKSQNAYIKVSENGTLVIESEIVGNEIDFDEAVAMCTENLSFGNTTIDFNLIIKVPEIVSTDSILNENVNAVNHIMSTVINFELTDGSIVTLDKETMKSWICVDDEGIYYVEGNNIRQFLEELNTKIQETENTVVFTPSGLDYQISLPVSSNTELSVNVEAEITQIREALAEGGTYTRMPIYEQEIDLSMNSSYVEIDITRQQIWMYYENECILDGVPCVTGNVGNHDTPTGVFHLTSKSRNAVLRGWNDTRDANGNRTRYASPVSFWMPFNGGIGMHDASWRHGVFGGEIYKGNGSHGCVNMRYEDAKTVYEHIDKSMFIIVYKSNET